MADKEQLAGYDEHGTDPTPELGTVEIPPSVPPASSPELRTLVAIAVGTLVVATLYIAQYVLIPITLAVMLSFVLSPLVGVLRRIGLWRTPAVALSVLLALGAIGLIGTLLGTQAASLAADVPGYVEAVQGKVESIQVFATTRVASITRLLGGRSSSTAPVANPAVRPRGAEPFRRRFLPARSNSRWSSRWRRQSLPCSRWRGPSSSRSLVLSRPPSLS
jgi:hypothetical protein